MPAQSWIKASGALSRLTVGLPPFVSTCGTRWRSSAIPTPGLALARSTITATALVSEVYIPHTTSSSQGNPSEIGCVGSCWKPIEGRTARVFALQSNCAKPTGGPTLARTILIQEGPNCKRSGVRQEVIHSLVVMVLVCPPALPRPRGAFRRGRFAGDTNTPKQTVRNPNLRLPHRDSDEGVASV